MPTTSNPRNAAPLPLIGRGTWPVAVLGAGLAIVLTALVGNLGLAAGVATAGLVASMGASAVLVFMVPASPLAQPWPVAGGHLLAAAVGLLVHLIGLPSWQAAGLAVGLAIGIMSLTRCLHPPAGGTVLITALAGSGDAATTWHFLLAPLGLNVAALLLGGMVWNRLSGHSYPHRPAAIPQPANWTGLIQDRDLDAVLDQWDEPLDISRADLHALLHATEAQVIARLADQT